MHGRRNDAKERELSVMALWHICLCSRAVLVARFPCADCSVLWHAGGTVACRFRFSWRLGFLSDRLVPFLMAPCLGNVMHALAHPLACPYANRSSPSNRCTASSTVGRGVWLGPGRGLNTQYPAVSPVCCYASAHLVVTVGLNFCPSASSETRNFKLAAADAACTRWHLDDKCAFENPSQQVVDNVATSRTHIRHGHGL